MTAADAIPIVLLPGMDGTGVLLADLKTRLLKRRRVEVISYPANPALGYSTLTAHVIERLPLGRCVILGESFSGPIAIEAAASEPDRIADWCSHRASPARRSQRWLHRLRGG